MQKLRMARFKTLSLVFAIVRSIFSVWYGAFLSRRKSVLAIYHNLSYVIDRLVFSFTP